MIRSTTGEDFVHICDDNEEEEEQPPLTVNSGCPDEDEVDKEEKVEQYYIEAKHGPRRLLDTTIALINNESSSSSSSTTSSMKRANTNLEPGLDDPTETSCESEIQELLNDEDGEDEAKCLGKEVLFTRTGGGNNNNGCSGNNNGGDNNPTPSTVSSYNGWDNLKWMSYAGTRKVAYVGSLSRFIQGKRTLFWSGDQYIESTIVVYTEPHLILILRPPKDINEVTESLDLPSTGTDKATMNELLQSHLMVESVIDPNTCKLRLSPLTTITSSIAGTNTTDVPADDYRRRTCFELLTPIENIILSAVTLRKGDDKSSSSFTDAGAFLETTRVEHILQKTICDAHRPQPQQQLSGSSVSNISTASDLSWKHQIILGTLHSYVVLGNESALTTALTSAKSASSVPTQSEYIDPRIIDMKDESGRTPLHYASSSRFTSAVSALIKAGADVDVKIEPNNLTSCHLAAMNLDFKSLEVILTATRRPGVIDCWGHTPMYLAMMEGRSVSGAKDPVGLEKCITILESYGGTIESPMGLPHAVHSLASQWSHGELETVLRHVPCSYPLSTPNVNEKRRMGISISAFYQYPLHTALIALRKAFADGQGTSISASTEKDVCRTLEVLFNCGFEPNERIEGVIEIFEGMDELAAHVGFTPIQILGATALDTMQQRHKLSDAMYLTTMKIISSVMFFMVSHGGRLSLEPPQSFRPRESESSMIARDLWANQGNGMKFQSHDSSLLKLQDNKRLIDLLGAMRLKSAEKSWEDLKNVVIANDTFSFQTDKLAIPNSEAPGGSDVRSCSICWVVFGTITNRKHRCRISRRHICNDCSSKSLLDNYGEQHRVSDGQFLLGRHNVVISKTRKVFPSTPKPTGLAKLEAQESENRDSLFGSVVMNVSKAVFGGDHKQNEAIPTSQATESVNGLSHRLNQTRNLLNERGEKLNSLADKSDLLANASKDFANMAKELNRQTQGGGFFW